MNLSKTQNQKYDELFELVIEKLGEIVEANNLIIKNDFVNLTSKLSCDLHIVALDMQGRQEELMQVQVH